MAIQALLVILAVLLVLLFLGVPISYAIAVSSLTAILSSIDLNVAVLTAAQRTFVGMSKFSLTAIPFFILAGNIMNQGGIAKRLVDFVMAILGKMPGALLVTNIGTNALFGAISGSGPATVAAIGALTIPAMIERGYDKFFSAALVAAAGCVGVMIPPSNPFVVYGVSSQVSIGDLFMGGIVPGILTGIVLMLYCYFYSKKRGWRGEQKERNWRTLGEAFWEAKWALVVPVIVLGGIYGGIMTPTEAAAVAAFYGLIVGVFLYREMDFKTVCSSCVASCETSSIIIVLMAMASAVGTLISDSTMLLYRP